MTIYLKPHTATCHANFYMLLFDGLFLNSLGGKLLMEYLINYIEKEKIAVHYLIDQRSGKSYEHIPDKKKTVLTASLKNRRNFYRQNAEKFTKIFCFANFAPPIRTKAIVYTYFHNVFIFDIPIVRGFEKLTWKLKTAALKYYKKNTDYYLFQTAFVRDTFCKKVGFAEEATKILPFYDVAEFEDILNKDNNTYAYIGDSYEYKNHKILFTAWAEINKTLPDLALHITISDPKIVSLTKQMANKGANIVNHGYIPYTQLRKLYKDSRYFIFPSLCETMGIGLIEAAKAQCEILVADVGYAQDVIKPIATFKPMDVADIVKKVLQNRHPDDSTALKTKLVIPDKVSEIVELLK